MARLLRDASGRGRAGGERPAEDGSLPLTALLSRPLVALAVEVERDSPVSLAIDANVLRVLAEDGTPLRDLPALEGVSKQAIATALGFLVKRRLVVVEPDPAGGRARIVRPTAAGREAHAELGRLLARVEAGCRECLGPAPVERLRDALRPFADALPPPSPGGWRAGRPRPATMPHYPLVLHRGGFPDGA